MIFKMKTIREECGGCPSHYTGETIHGQILDMYLRGGLMKITLDDHILAHSATTEFDGVCSLEDFKKAARRNGYFINTDDAQSSSAINDLEKTIQELFADSVWVTFVRDFYSKSIDKTFVKGQAYTVSLKSAPVLLKTGLAVIAHEHDQAKLDAYWNAKTD